MARRLAAAALFMLVATIASAGNSDWSALVDAYGRLNATQRPEFVKILVRKSPAHAERAVRNLVAAYPSDKSSITAAATAAAPSQAAAIRKVSGKAPAAKAPTVMEHTSGMGYKSASNSGMSALDKKVAALAKFERETNGKGIAPDHLLLTDAEIAQILSN